MRGREALIVSLICQLLSVCAFPQTHGACAALWCSGLGPALLALHQLAAQIQPQGAVAGRQALLAFISILHGCTPQNQQAMWE
jgi:hypothetical protein